MCIWSSDGNSVGEGHENTEGPLRISRELEAYCQDASLKSLWEVQQDSEWIRSVLFFGR